MQKDEFITNFLMYGFSTTIEKCLLKGFSFENLINAQAIDGLEYITEYTEEQKKYLLKFRTYIEQNYVSRIFTNYTCLSENMWDGVDNKSCGWHNDNKEGQDSCFLYYIDNSSEKVGGALYFKNDIEEYKIYPKSGTLVWMSQQSNYLHRADRSTRQRRVVHLEYKH